MPTFADVATLMLPYADDANLTDEPMPMLRDIVYGVQVYALRLAVSERDARA